MCIHNNTPNILICWFLIYVVAHIIYHKQCNTINLTPPPPMDH
jgi:hypothetical protein